MRDGMQFGRDAGLASLWDEICVQIQGEQSVMWSAHDGIVRSMLWGLVTATCNLERVAVWLQTKAGIDWLCNADEEDLECLRWEQTPVSTDDVVDYLVQELHNHAANWENRRIRHFIESRYEMDD